MKPEAKIVGAEQLESDRTAAAGVALPADWERYPALVQALQVLVDGAVRLLRQR